MGGGFTLWALTGACLQGDGDQFENEMRGERKAL